ncbi:MAG: hypothetical protein PVF15_03700 [Candidatus Bathyarchaeota archaeon]
MCFKIGNELKHSDYKRLTDFLKDNENISIEIFLGVDLDFVSINPITVAVEGFGYKIDAEAVLKQPIGFEVYNGLKLDDDTNASIRVNRRNLKLSKIVAEQVDLERDLNMILKIVERIVNHVCIRFGGLIEKVFTLNSESLDQQLSLILESEELEKRAEVPRPFGTMHAKDSRDAKERAGGLIPLYKERDKTYLYDAKRVYFLLPHDFVANLLRCDDTTMVREEEFDKRGKEVLRDLVYKKHLKKHETMGGIVCYYSLDGKTRRYLIKHLERRTSRL